MKARLPYFVVGKKVNIPEWSQMGVDPYDYKCYHLNGNIPI
jgi:hypothetical protein